MLSIAKAIPLAWDFSLDLKLVVYSRDLPAETFNSPCLDGEA